MPEGEIPNGTKVDINGLQSDAAKWMNGQKVGQLCEMGNLSENGVPENMRKSLGTWKHNPLGTW